MTLVEILLAIFVLVIGVLSVLLFYTNAMKMSQLAQDITVATTYGEYILEEAKVTPYSDLTNTLYWDSWISAEGLNALNNANILVTANGEIDPIEVEACIRWDHCGRTYDITLTTEITNSTLP